MRERGFSVTSGAVLVVPKSLIEPVGEVHVSSGGLLIILEEGQTPDDAARILAENARAKLERDKFLLQQRAS
jgi:hypothetical protein